MRKKQLEIWKKLTVFSTILSKGFPIKNDGITNRTNTIPSAKETPFNHLIVFIDLVIR